MIEIEFLYFESCPTHASALQLLRETIREEGAEADVTLRTVQTPEEAERLNFPGSPTIRVQGEDIEPSLVAGQVGFSCRAYRDADGRVTGLPPRQYIVDALRRAR